MVQESKKDEAKGRVKEAAGDLTDDQELKREGKADQIGADAKEKVEKAKDTASDFVDKAKETLSGSDKS